MAEFRDPTLDELYGPSRLDQPLSPNRVNWKQVGAYLGLTALAVGVPVALALLAVKKKQEKLFLEKRKEEERKRSAAKDGLSDDEIVGEVFRDKQRTTRSRRSSN